MMNFPEELKYTKDHEWIKVSGNEAFVGITDFAQQELGDIVFVDITELGNVVEAGAVFGSVEAVKTVSDLFMPITGTVLETNPAIDANPELVNSDPYGEGWMIKISIEDPAQIAGLLDRAAYTDLVGA